MLSPGLLKTPALNSSCSQSLLSNSLLPPLPSACLSSSLVPSSKTKCVVPHCCSSNGHIFLARPFKDGTLHLCPAMSWSMSPLPSLSLLFQDSLVKRPHPASYPFGTLTTMAPKVPTVRPSCFPPAPDLSAPPRITVYKSCGERLQLQPGEGCLSPLLLLTGHQPLYTLVWPTNILAQQHPLREVAGLTNILYCLGGFICTLKLPCVLLGETFKVPSTLY